MKQEYPSGFRLAEIKVTRRRKLIWKGRAVMTKKRIFAWIALIFFVFYVVNILFLHFYVTASATVFLMYVLVFYFGNRRGLYSNTQHNIDDNPENGEDIKNIQNTNPDEELQGNKVTDDN